MKLLKGDKDIHNLAIIWGGGVMISQFQVFGVIVNNFKKAEQIGN